MAAFFKNYAGIRSSLPFRPDFLLLLAFAAFECFQSVTRNALLVGVVLLPVSASCQRDFGLTF